MKHIIILLAFYSLFSCTLSSSKYESNFKRLETFDQIEGNQIGLVIDGGEASKYYFEVIDMSENHGCDGLNILKESDVTFKVDERYSKPPNILVNSIMGIDNKPESNQFWALFFKSNESEEWKYAQTGISETLLTDGSILGLSYTHWSEKEGEFSPEFAPRLTSFATVSKAEMFSYSFYKNQPNRKKAKGTCESGSDQSDYKYIGLDHYGYPAGAQFKITIQRSDYTNRECISGYLSINDNSPVCYTLELPWLYNIRNKSCIPEGSYYGKIRTDGSKGWRIQLEGVPNRDWIQIHIGNYIREIEGCILVGKDTNPRNCEVSKSDSALEILRNELETDIFLGNVNMSPNIILEIK